MVGGDLFSRILMLRVVDLHCDESDCKRIGTEVHLEGAFGFRDIPST